MIIPSKKNILWVIIDGHPNVFVGMMMGFWSKIAKISHPTSISTDFSVKSNRSTCTAVLVGGANCWTSLGPAFISRLADLGGPTNRTPIGLFVWGEIWP